MKVACLVALLTFASPSHADAQRQIDLTGKPDAAIADGFTMVTGVRELPGNLAVVTDQFEHLLFLANFATKALAPLGRQGEGPAEYRFPMMPLAGPANTTVVMDATLRRTLTISADGKIVSTAPVPTAGLTAGVVSAFGTDRSGRMYFEGNSFDQSRGSFSDSVAIVRWNPRDERAVVLGKVWSGGRVIVKRADGNMSMARSITPFPSMDAWAVRPNGDVLVVHHEPFRVDVIDTTGAIKPGLPLPYQPLAVTAADRAAHREKMKVVRSGAALKNGGMGQQRMGQTVSDEEFPKTLPPFVAASVIVTPEGELWIGRSHAASDATWRYDIVDVNGKVAGFAKLAANARVVGFGTGTVYVARTDPTDDLVYLERYRR